MALDSSPHSSEDVLNDLDPLSRALLDLSVQRQMDDAEIAQVLGTDEASVFEVRVALLRNLAEQVAPEYADSELPELEAAVAGRLYDGGTADGGRQTAKDGRRQTAAPAGVQPAVPAPAPEKRRRSPLVFLLPLLLVATIVALIVALAGGDEDDTNTPRTQPTAGEEKPPAPPDDGRVRLTTLGSGGAAGTARLSGDRLQLTLRDLPPRRDGVYTVWLYNSVIDAKALRAVRGDSVSVALPGDARKYEFLDVSLEPRDGNPNHSGRSILRAPLRKLER